MIYVLFKLLLILSMMTEDSFFQSRKYQTDSGHTIDLILGWIFKNAKIGTDFRIFRHFRIKITQFEVGSGTILTNW